MARVEKSIEIEKPLRMVYDQWTQFEEFPRFMEGVEEVQQIDDKTLHWTAKIGGQARGVGGANRPAAAGPVDRVAAHRAAR